jgi:tRNA threonylcarbamoyladenosine modification (KEOPS) complex  Pcc1 subunit
MKYQAEMRFCLRSNEYLTALIDALTPETERAMNRRAHAVLETQGELVILKVEAKDVVALRASLNAYLRWMSSAVKVLEVVKNSSQIITK